MSGRFNIFEVGLEENNRPPSPTVEERGIQEGEAQSELVIRDFIDAYVEYADVIEAPREAHEMVAISLLAAALNEKVHFRNGALLLSLDLWVLLLSGSGLGRNTLVDLARPILEEAGLSSLVKSVDWGSKQAFYQYLAENPVGLFLWPEFSVVLKTFNSATFSGAKGWITDRFDNRNIPDSTRYRNTKKQSDTPSIVFNQAPRINLLATSSYDWFVGSLDEQDSTGGFIPRWLIVQLAEPTKLVPIPQETDQQLIAPLAGLLRRASQLEGEADLSAVSDIYSNWYEETRTRFREQSNRALAMPFFQRMRTNILKLAIVFEVSQSESFSVSPEAMRRAIDFVSKLEQTLSTLLSTGMTKEGSEVDKIADCVREAGADGLSQSELTKAFQNVKAPERHGRICTLEEAGTVHRFRRATPGRSAIVFVHQDYLEKYKSLFPSDVQVR